jgi:hypothetical protein
VVGIVTNLRGIKSRLWCGVEGYRQLSSEETRVLEGKETYKEEERRNKNEVWEKEEKKEGNAKNGYRC